MFQGSLVIRRAIFRSLDKTSRQQQIVEFLNNVINKPTQVGLFNKLSLPL